MTRKHTSRGPSETTTRVISVIAICGVVLVLIPWMIVFFTTTLSTEPSRWEAFGAYVGGVLSPFIAALALIAFLRTISQQQTQITQLKLQGAKSDLQHVIENTEDDYSVVLKSHRVVVNVEQRAHDFTGLDVMTRLVFPAYQSVMVNQDDIEQLLKNNNDTLAVDDPRLAAMETFSRAAGHLMQLRLFVQKHDEISGNNALTKYYHRKYKLAYGDL